MRTVNFFGHNTGRLILGTNPYSGYSYIPEKVTYDDMVDFYTTENILRDLRYAETLGYTTFIATTDDFTKRYYRQYRNEGGKLKWIAQTEVPLDINACVNNAIEGGAIAIFHQGTMGDGFFETGNLAQYKANLEVLRRANVPVGIATHVPDFVEIAEKEFNLDFYMLCLHNMRRENEGRVSSSLSGVKNQKRGFAYEDREAMLKVIKSLDKPCIAYKILGGGNYAFTREDLKRCYVETFTGIKPNDVASVGVFQRDSDQLKENADVLEEVLSEIG